MSSSFEMQRPFPRPVAGRVAEIAVLLCSAAPLFVLTVRSWTPAVLFLGCLLSLALLCVGRLPRPALAADDRRWLHIVLATLAAPTVAVAISAALRGNFEGSQFDAPSRFVLAIPILLLVLRSGVSPGSLMQWLLPAALAFALARLEIDGPDPHWGPERQTTYMVDPLVFGYLSLAFGLMALSSIGPRDWQQGKWARVGVVVRVAGALLGVYLSVRSGSRSGWLAMPIVLGVWLHHSWGRGHPMATARALALAVAIPAAAYLLVPPVTARVDLAVREVTQYTWDAVPAETSVGLRITFLRIAGDVFAMHPLAGVGDTSRMPPAPPSAFRYASPGAVEAAFSSAFHNQVVSSAVRNGIAGLLAAAALLLVPLLVCARGLRRAGPGAAKDAAMGVAFCACLLVSSLSTEVVDLKFAASLYAVMVALFCGATLARARAP